MSKPLVPGHALPRLEEDGKVIVPDVLRSNRSIWHHEHDLFAPLLIQELQGQLELPPIQTQSVGGN